MSFAESGPVLTSALLLGAVGSVHCIGMCGGIAGALGQATASRGPLANLASAGLYSLGRIASYAMAGGAVGWLGEAFSARTGWVVFSRVATGVLILACGLHVAGLWNGLARIERWGLPVWQRLRPLTQRLGRPDRSWKILALGMLWGWLPCGLVYTALLGAAASGKAELGAGFMLAFGLGTLPALLAASGVGASLGSFLRLRTARRAAGSLLLVFGLWSISAALMPWLHGDGSGTGPHAHIDAHPPTATDARFD